MKIQVLCCFLFILIGAISSQNTRCPFNYLYQFGDSVTDIGNTMYFLPWGRNAPSARPPYGITYPGWPTGRWSDGRTDFDYTSADFGLPNVVPYLGMNTLASNDGVVFSVPRSPVLNLTFLESRGIDVPPYAHAPLDTQIRWFETYLKYSACSSPADCSSRLADSLVLFSDVHANDIGYALTQNKTIEEIQTYVPLIIETTVNHARDLINMGARRVVIAGNAPVGCFPYILTALDTDDPTAYDEVGCLKSVNELIRSKNADLEQAVVNLRNEFPNLPIFFGDVYNATLTVIRESSVIGPDGINVALKTCCGIGGKYNFDQDRFCGNPDVPFCSNPSEYIFWDGLHSTQEGYLRVQQLLFPGAFTLLNCTTELNASI